MIIATKQLKNGKKRAKLIFDSGKIINLKPSDWQDLESRIKWEIQTRQDLNLIMKENSNDLITKI
jgi:hypothetical protein